jgi:hypothetical protein
VNYEKKFGANLDSFFTWENSGIYHFAGSPDSGFLRDVKLYVQKIIENKLVFWIDFPNRFATFNFKDSEHLNSLQVFRPDSLDTSIKVIDTLEINYFVKSAESTPYLLVADFPFWYSLGKESKRSVLTKVTLIIAWLSMYAKKYKFKVLLVNELRGDLDSGFTKPYLDFLIHRYTTENYYKE